TRGYERIREDTRGYERIREDTRGYERIREDTRGYERIPFRQDLDHALNGDWRFAWRTLEVHDGPG
ncbi:MAG TPA: hypothetical protein VEQ60_04450, partial [Longimicrobium sp.]|nr:hypothetical protein [Longimicrobium sp.]